jgi:hypothetical protein
VVHGTNLLAVGDASLACVGHAWNAASGGDGADEAENEDGETHLGFVVDRYELTEVVDRSSGDA